MTPDRYPATLLDFVAQRLRMHTDTGAFNAVLSLSGRLDESRLQQAVRLVVESEPILGCRFEDHWYRPCWRRRDDLDELPLCQVVEPAASAGDLAGFLAASLDPASEPLVKTCVFRGPTDTICIKTPHAVMDGPSMVRLLPMLAGIYSRLGAEPAFAPPRNPSDLRALKHLSQKLTVRQKLQALRRFAANRSQPAATWAFPEGDPAELGYVMLRLPPDRAAALLSYGRQRRVTLTVLLLAAAYLAARDVFQAAAGQVHTFTTTADLRRFLPPELRQTTPSNMSAPGRFALDPRAAGDFESVLESIRAQLKVMLDDPGSIASAAVLFLALPGLKTCFDLLPFSVLGRRLDKVAGSLNASPGRRWAMANFGKLDPAALRFGDLAVEDAYLTGPLCLGPGIVLTASSFCDTLTLALGVSGRTMDLSAAGRFLGQIDRHLPACDTAPGSVVTYRATSQEAKYAE